MSETEYLEANSTQIKLYEGKAKCLYQTMDPEVLICHFKDDATAFNAQKKGSIARKGEINCLLTQQIFTYLEARGIPTHLISQISPQALKVKAVRILPLEVVVRNRVAGSLCKRLGLEKGQIICPPLVEFYYKNDDLQDPLVTLDHIQLLKLATPSDVDRLKTLALEINHHLQAFFRDCQLELVDFKLEFGLTSTGEMVLADEISPDTCRLWDLSGSQVRVLDKDLFRFDLGDASAGYEEVLRRVISRSEVARESLTSESLSA
jgi:phosphoribosylaminoimidazole-succinocarboxamide synthase